MARYIDADAFKELITEQGNIQNNKGAAYWLCVLIDEQPTANVAPIADTVREMQERLNEQFHDRVAYTRSYVHDTIDQIAKEVLEGNDGHI